MHQVPPFLRACFLLPGLGLITAGCDELLGSKTCTDVWCGSEAGVVLTRPGVWANGDYTLEVRLDGQVHVCSFSLPISGKLPHELRLSGEPFDCAPELPSSYRPSAAALYPTPDETQSCRATMDAGLQPPLASCPPLDARYHIELNIAAAPDELGVRLALGDTVLFEQSAAIQYRRFEPNGPECGPVCYQAEVEYTVPEPE
jgi:hypothetical protein